MCRAQGVGHELVDGSPTARVGRDSHAREHGRHPALVVGRTVKVEAIDHHEVFGQVGQRLEDGALGKRKGRAAAGGTSLVVDGAVGTVDHHQALHPLVAGVGLAFEATQGGREGEGSPQTSQETTATPAGRHPDLRHTLQYPSVRPRS